MAAASQREQLQLLVGGDVPISLESFSNRAGTQFRNVVIAARPNTVKDLQQVVRSCLSLRLRVRSVSHGLSLGPLFPEENQVVIYTDQLQPHDGERIQLFRNDLDPNLSEVTALCCVTMQELLDFQLKNSVELPGNVINRFSTVGGCVSSMSHGVGLHVQTLSDLVVRMRIVDASGSLRVYDLRDPELLNAAKGSLGLFGIVYDVTFRVAPLSVVEVENRWISAGHLFYERNFLSGIVHNNVSCQMLWWPLSSLSRFQRVNAFLKKHVRESQWVPQQDEVMVRIINRPGAVPAEIPTEGLGFHSYWHGWSFKKNKWFSKNVPAATPFSITKHRDAIRGQCWGKSIQPVPYAVHFFGDIDENPLWEMEFVFNHDPDCVNLQVAIMAMIEVVKEESVIGNYPLALPVEIGVMGASTAYLSPSYTANPAAGGSGFAAYIRVSTFIGTEGWREFCTGLVQRWIKIPGICPSWGHQWSFLPEINNIISANAQAGIAQFKVLHERAACDPGRVFFTERLESIIFGAPVAVSPDGSQPQIVYPSPNNQQVHGQVVQVANNPQLVQQTAQGQVALVQQSVNGQNGVIFQGGQNILHDHQILANPGGEKHQKKKLSDLFNFKPRDKRHRHGHDDRIISPGNQILAYNGHQQGLGQQAGNPQQLVLVRPPGGGTGNVIQQQVVQGIPQQGIPQQGIPQQGILQQGIPQQGIHQQGIPQQGIPQQGIPQQGILQQGIYQQGIPQQGIPQQGIYQQGIPQQGIPQQGNLQQAFVQNGGSKQQQLILVQAPQGGAAIQGGGHMIGGTVPQQLNKIYVQR